MHHNRSVLAVWFSIGEAKTEPDHVSLGQRKLRLKLVADTVRQRNSRSRGHFSCYYQPLTDGTTYQ
jgi:hypothetical protein